MALVLALSIALASGGSAQTAIERSHYRLGPGDELRIKVYEWRLSVNNLHEWTALNGDYKVGPDGTVALPLLGHVSVEGLTVATVQTAIAERLQQKIGLANRPDAAVQLIGFRPFFIVGAVKLPGEYPYRPGTTILRAVAIAGGLGRVAETSALEVERAWTQAMGEWRLLLTQRNQLAIRDARLTAELENKVDIAVPADVLDPSNQADIAELIRQEQVIAKSRRETFQAKIVSMRALRDLLEQETASLNAKTTNAEQEIKMVRGELENISKLLRSGLATSPREFGLRQSTVQLEGQRLDLDTALLRARQAINRLDQQMTDLRNEYRDELLREQHENERRLVEISEKLRTQRGILRDYDAARMYFSGNGGDQLPPRYSIIRRLGDEEKETPASELTAVQPGDVIRVVQPLERIGIADRPMARLGSEDGGDKTTARPANPGAVTHR